MYYVCIVDCWYKNDKYFVTEDNKILLIIELAKFLRGKERTIVNVYASKDFFYLKTAQNVLLQAFLDTHSFRASNDDLSNADLELVFGED